MTKIFIHDVTLLDCAILSHSLGPTGKSWYVDACLEGNKDSNGMLFDFSFAKKIIKSVIDEEFDHKIHVSSKQAQHQTDSLVAISSPIHHFYLKTYSNAVKIWDFDDLEHTPFLEEKIEQSILKNLPKNVEKVKITLRNHSQKESSGYFKFTHGLCSHCGNCQRFHGHSSIVSIYKNGILDQNESKKIAQKLDDKFLIWKEHINKDLSIDSSLYTIQYTGSQGTVMLRTPKEHVILLDCESTIENIAEYIHSHFYSSDPTIQIHVYEGLAKGAIHP